VTSKQIRILILAGALAFVVGLLTTLKAQDATAQEPSVRFDVQVRDKFFSGYAGNHAALDEGMKICEDALAKNPKLPEALVWHGSGLLYLSGESFRGGDQQKGMELYTRGTDEMDQAVALKPDSIGVRAPRGATLMVSTLFMDGNPQVNELIEKALSDYEYIYNLQKDHWTEIGPHSKGQLLLGLGSAYSRLGQDEKARVAFERLATDLKGTEYEPVAQAWLKTKTLDRRQQTCFGCHVSK
jgi:tetratricopeptide (TPR) repeat protein